MAEQSKSAETVVANVTNAGAMAKMSKFADALKGRAEVESAEVDGQEIAASIAEKILNAETVDDIFAISESGMPGGRDLVGVEQRIHYFTVRQGKDSDIKNDLVGGTFLVVHATKLSDGSELIWDTSATQLVAQLVALERKHAIAEQSKGKPVFPIDVMIVDVGGKGALALRPVAKRAV